MIFLEKPAEAYMGPVHFFDNHCRYQWEYVRPDRTGSAHLTDRTVDVFASFDYLALVKVNFIVAFRSHVI